MHSWLTKLIIPSPLLLWTTAHRKGKSPIHRTKLQLLINIKNSKIKWEWKNFYSKFKNRLKWSKKKKNQSKFSHDKLKFKLASPMMNVGWLTAWSAGMKVRKYERKRLLIFGFILRPRFGVEKTPEELFKDTFFLIWSCGWWIEDGGRRRWDFRRSGKYDY